MRIVFMGTPDFAETALGALLDGGFDVVGVFTQPDKPVGRKQILTPMMSPASRASAINWAVTPVSASPLMTAHWMGAAPRYFGKSEPWILTHPRVGRSRMVFGRMRP